MPEPGTVSSDRQGMRRWRPVAVSAATVGVLAGCTVSSRVRDAASQAWPPFVLVTGLLLIGVAAHTDGVFTAAGDRISGLHIGTRGLFVLTMGLVAAVTVVLTEQAGQRVQAALDALRSS